MSKDTDNPEQRIQALEVHLKAIEGNEKRAFESIRTCVGMLTGVTVLLIGYGWFKSNDNYQRDRLNLQHEVLREMEKQFTNYRTESRRDFDKLQSELRGQMSEQSTFSRQEHSRIRQDLSKQVELDVQAAKQRQDAEFALFKIEQATKHQQLTQEIQTVRAKAIGSTFFQQGIRLLSNKSYVSATDSFLVAALSFEAIGEEANLQKCIRMLRDDCLPILKKADLDSEPDITTQLQELLARLEKKYPGGRYMSEVRDLRASFETASKRLK